MGLPPALINERFGQARLAASLARATLGLALDQVGRFHDAVVRVQEGLQIAEAARHAYSISSELYSLGVVYLLQGDDAAALRVLERSREAWQTLQSPPWTTLNAALGLARCRTSDLGRGLSLIDTGSVKGQPDFIYPAVTALAEGYLLAGRAPESALHAGQAVDLARTAGMRGNEAIALRFVADCAASSEPLIPEAAGLHYHAAMSLAQTLRMRPLVAHCHLGLAKLYGRTDNREQAQDHLTIATTMYREMGMTYRGEKAETVFD